MDVEIRILYSDDRLCEVTLTYVRFRLDLQFSGSIRLNIRRLCVRSRRTATSTDPVDNVLDLFSWSGYGAGHDR